MLTATSVFFRIIGRRPQFHWLFVAALALAMLSLCVGTLAADNGNAGVPLPDEPPRYVVETPDVVLRGVPVSRIVIRALDRWGDVDTEFHGRPLIRGIQLTVDGRDTALPAFEAGVLELETDLAARQKVYVVAGEIVVDPEREHKVVHPVSRLSRWFSLVPLAVAIGLAIWLRNILVALFVAVWSGAVILAHGNFFVGFVSTLDTFILGELTQPGEPVKSHMTIILFTMSLGAMVGVMAASGGTLALVGRLARFTQKREHGQLMTWFLGLLVFFDDYANTLLLGSTMRPVTDRLKVSREKLAFLVDSTAAPIAGLALISTWVGVEISYIQDTYNRLGMDGDVYSTFLATLPYRFYPLHLLVFVWLIAYSGHDYGPMLRAEARALAHGQLTRPGALVPGVEDDERLAGKARRQLARNALVPLAVLLSLILAGLWWTGMSGLNAANAALQQQGAATIPVSFWSVLDHSQPNRVLFLGSFLASLVALATATFSRSLTLQESLEAWLSGAKSMFLAVVILVLAWGIATVCDENHLNTAGFLVEITRGMLSVSWMPALAFLLAAGVAFATGSSWSTMGLLMPLFISITYYLLVDLNEADPNHHILLAVIGAILAGAIFGDHCSPISDTTVLSSAASGCDHIDHVATQIPYAGSVAAVAVLLGYIPVGFGYSPIVLLPLGVFVLYLLVQFLGMPVEEYVKTASMRETQTPAAPEPDATPDSDGNSDDDDDDEIDVPMDFLDDK